MNEGVHASGIEAQMLDLFLFMGSAWVLYLLMFLSVISLAIAIERALHFYWHREDVEALSQRLRSLFGQADLDGAKGELEGKNSHVANILRAGVETVADGADSVEETIQGAKLVEKLKMERGLAFLGTLGNNAPFLGLFGTVLGIIRAFRDLAANTSEGAQAVMGGIAEALIATAVGLLVALPAVAIFNIFQRQIKSRLAEADAVGHTLMAYLKKPAS